MKKTINIISLLALVITLFIVIISCGTGVKFNNILGSSSTGGGGNNGGNNLNFPLFFDGQYQNDYESFSSIVPTSDGGYFITGMAKDYTQNPPIDDALFVKLNRDLTIAWSKLGSIGIRGTFGFENIEIGSNTVSFLGGIEGNNVFYFGFQNYTQNRFYLIKTDINLNKQGEVSISGSFNVSLVPEPSSNNVILALYDRNNNNLVLIKLDSTLNVNRQVKISNFSPYYEYYYVMYFISLANNFLIPGTFNSNGLIYTFDYNLNPPCGNTSSSNLNLQNTNDITINTNPTTHPTLQSGSITVNSANTATTDYPLTEINACPIN